MNENPGPGIYRYDVVADMEGRDDAYTPLGNKVRIVDDAGEMYDIEIRSDPRGGFVIHHREINRRYLVVAPNIANQVTVGTIADYRF